MFISPLASSFRSFYQRYSYPLTLALILRVGLSIWLAILWVLFIQKISNNEMAMWQSYYHMPAHSSPVARAFLGVWLRWDAVHYMNIAYFGYPSLGPGELNFWPLYPYSIRAVKLITGADVTFIGLTLSTIATACAMVFLYQLVISKFGNQQLAAWTVLTFGLYPTSFFLFAPFTEALFACFSAGMLLALHHKRWITAGFLVFFASLTRAQGILLLIPLILELFRDSYIKANWFQVRGWIAIIFSPSGLMAFLLWRNQQSTMDVFRSFETYSKAEFVAPIWGIVLAVRKLIENPDWIQISELLSVCVFLALFFFMLIKREFRAEYPIVIYGLAVVLFATIKHTPTVSPMQSSNRYVLTALPAFIAMAWLILRLPVAARKYVIVSFASFLIVASTLYSLWLFVG